MAIVEPEEMISTERVALVVKHLMLGDRLTTAEVARMTGLERTGAYRLLTKVSTVLSLTQENGRWYVLPT